MLEDFFTGNGDQQRKIWPNPKVKTQNGLDDAPGQKLDKQTRRTYRVGSHTGFNHVNSKWTDLLAMVQDNSKRVIFYAF